MAGTLAIDNIEILWTGFRKGIGMAEVRLTAQEQAWMDRQGKWKIGAATYKENTRWLKGWVDLSGDTPRANGDEHKELVTMLGRTGETSAGLFAYCKRSASFNIRPHDREG